MAATTTTLWLVLSLLIAAASALPQTADPGSPETGSGEAPAESRQQQQVERFLALVLDRYRAPASAGTRRANHRRRSVEVVDRKIPPPPSAKMIHIRLESEKDVARIMERLGDEFAIRATSPTNLTSSAAPDPRFDFVATPRRRRKMMRSSRRRIKGAPKWMSRGHVCRVEVRRTRRWSDGQLSRMVQRRSCRNFSDRFACVVRYGRGRSPMQPSVTNVWRCCSGHQLNRKKSRCRPLRSSSDSNKRTRVTSAPGSFRRRVNSPPPTTMTPRARRRRLRRRKKIDEGPAPLLSDASPDPEPLKLAPMNNFTTFVPTDNILNQGTQSGRRNRGLNHILDNSVIPDEVVYSEDVSHNQIFRAVSGNRIRFNKYDHVITVNCRNVSSRDLPVDDGDAGGGGLVYHVIDGLLYDVRKTIGDFVRDRPQRFSQLYAALTRLGTISELEREAGNLTLFAPTDDALSRLPVPLEDETDACLRHVIDSHVVDDVLCSAAAEISYPAQTRSKLPLFTKRARPTNRNASSSSSSSFVNGVELIKPDMVTTNGVVHVVKRLLYKIDSLADMLESDPSLSGFHTMLVDANLIDELVYARNATLIAPSNAALQKLTSEERDALRRDRSRLLRHLVAGRAELEEWSRDDHRSSSPPRQFRMAAAKSEGNVHAARYHASIKVTEAGPAGPARMVTTRNGVSLQCARVSGAQPTVTSSCAGALVMLDDVMPEASSSLFQVVRTDPDLSTLLGIVRANNLAPLFLEAEVDYTFLAPNNYAFQRFAIFVREKLFSNPETARRIISFHLVRGFRCKDELLQRAYRHFTRNGQTLISCPKHRGTRLLLGRSPLRLRSNVVRFDLVADNGLVHAIDNLLLPKRYNALLYPDD